MAKNLVMSKICCIFAPLLDDKGGKFHSCGRFFLSENKAFAIIEAVAYCVEIMRPTVERLYHLKAAQYGSRFFLAYFCFNRTKK